MSNRSKRGRRGHGQTTTTASTISASTGAGAETGERAGGKERWVVNGVNVLYGSNNVNVGRLKEFPNISVDHFYGESLKATAFFLTHAHTDHMVGLEGPDFLERLNQPGVHLYTQLLTPIILQSFIRYFGGVEGLYALIRREKIVPLDTQGPYILQIPTGREDGTTDSVTVTLISAGHCPGSVMFLFETETPSTSKLGKPKPVVRVLHTGDFRLSVDQLKGLRYLHEERVSGPGSLPPHERPRVPFPVKEALRAGKLLQRKNNSRKRIAEWGAVKRIDHLYLDTTFCTSDYAESFPDRFKVAKEAVEEVRKWLGEIGNWNERQDGKWIFIKFAAKFAHEFVLEELARAFKVKIHVSSYRANVYAEIPSLKECTTMDPRTPLHFCDDRKCQIGESLEMKLSSMWCSTARRERDEGLGLGTVVRTARRLNVCYSMHPSLIEVAETIDYLKPRIVTPLVKPVGADSITEVKAYLDGICHASFTYEDYQSPSVLIVGAAGSGSGSGGRGRGYGYGAFASTRPSNSASGRGRGRGRGRAQREETLEDKLTEYREKLRVNNEIEEKRLWLKNIWKSSAKTSSSSVTITTTTTTTTTMSGSQERRAKLRAAEDVDPDNPQADSDSDEDDDQVLVLIEKQPSPGKDKDKISREVEVIEVEVQAINPVSVSKAKRKPLSISPTPTNRNLRSASASKSKSTSDCSSSLAPPPHPTKRHGLSPRTYRNLAKFFGALDSDSDSSTSTSPQPPQPLLPEPEPVKQHEKKQDEDDFTFTPPKNTKKSTEVDRNLSVSQRRRKSIQRQGQVFQHARPSVTSTSTSVSLDLDLNSDSGSETDFSPSPSPSRKQTDNKMVDSQPRELLELEASPNLQDPESEPEPKSEHEQEKSEDEDDFDIIRQRPMRRSEIDARRRQIDIDNERKIKVQAQLQKEMENEKQKAKSNPKPKPTVSGRGRGRGRGRGKGVVVMERFVDKDKDGTIENDDGERVNVKGKVKYKQDTSTSKTSKSAKRRLDFNLDSEEVAVERFDFEDDQHQDQVPEGQKKYSGEWLTPSPPSARSRSKSTPTDERDESKVIIRGRIVFHIDKEDEGEDERTRKRKREQADMDKEGNGFGVMLELETSTTTTTTTSTCVETETLLPTKSSEAEDEVMFVKMTKRGEREEDDEDIEMVDLTQSSLGSETDFEEILSNCSGSQEKKRNSQ